MYLTSNFEKSSFEKGKEFEDYVETVLFPRSHYNLVEKTHDFMQNSDRFVESSWNPDFKFRCIKTQKEFWIEAKYRSHFDYEDKVTIIDLHQFKRHYEKNTVKCPVFLVIGLEGRSNAPRKISLMHISEIEYDKLYGDVLAKYQIKPDKPVNFEVIAKYFMETQSNTPEVIPKPDIPKKRGYKSNWFAAGIVLALILFGFLFYPIINHNDNKHHRKDLLKENIGRYYKVTESNNVAALDNFLCPDLVRWYDQRNVGLEAVKKEIVAYNSKYPTRKAEILWDTYQQSLLPTGEYNVYYELFYEVSKRGALKNQKFHLGIFSVWTRELKIKSMYEVKL